MKRENPDEKYITVNGINIRYVVKGNGPPILLIHGFGEFLETWWFNIDPLSEHYRIYAMDLPGHGLSDKPAIDYNLPFARESAIHFMQALDIERASLVGHSLGGLLGISVAINFPDKVDRLILVDSGGLAEDAPLLYRLCTLPIVGNVIIKSTVKSFIKHGIKKAFYNPDLVTEEMIDLDYEFLKMPGTKEALLSIIRNGVSLSGPYPEIVMTDKLHLIKCPTLLIHGEEDEVIPVVYAQKAYKLIPKARLEVINECGHCPHIEKASQFNKLVVAFLQSNEPEEVQSGE